MELNSETAVAVTGASRGIGRAVAEALASRGVKIALLARGADALDAVAESCRTLGAADLIVRAGDVGEAEVTAKWMDEIMTQWGGLDVLINNAALRGKKPIEELTDEDWDSVIGTNLTGPFRLMRAVIGPMRRRGGGHIVNVSSIAGEVAFATGGAYCASKFGLQGLSECLMAEVRRDGIKVTIVCPGSVDTHFDDKHPTDTSWKIPPEEIARTVVYALEAPGHVMASKLHIRPTLQGKK